MKPTILYFHGLGSDRNSRKFREIKNYFQDQFNYDCIQWNNQSVIESLLDEAEIRLTNTVKPIIIGDSTGANFAYQLREKLSENGKESILILTSPLLDIGNIIADFEFPEQIASQLKKYNNPKNALIISAKNDEILNQNNLFKNCFENVKLINANDNHRLEMFQVYLPEIKKYISEN